MTIRSAHFRLYSRNYCHLCHDMLAALEALRDQHGLDFAIEVIDIDADSVDPALLERYDEKVPVLVAVSGNDESELSELCHYFLDGQAVLSYLQTCSFHKS